MNIGSVYCFDEINVHREVLKIRLDLWLGLGLELELELVL